MKFFLSIFKAESLKKNILNIISRFPISVLIVFAVSTLLFTQLHGNFSESINNNIIRAIFSLIITFFFSVGVYINSENLGFSKLGKNLGQIIPVGFGILFFLGFKSDLDNFENFIFFILSLAGIIAYLFFAPYIKNILSKNIKQTIYYTYFYKISVIFLISTILGVVLFALGSIGIGAIFSLFDLDGILTHKIYEDWSILSLSFITPIFALTQIPKKESFNENHFNENVFFSFLVKYIAIPFIYIYFIILYAYSIKVLANFGDWPKGEVSWMVIGFSIFGYIIYIFSYIFELKNKFIKIFRKGFPFVVIPQLFMLFYAIYLRIAQYDVTVNRYFVVVFGIWLAIISVYLILSKRKFLGCIPFILTVFTIIISIGPWSVYNLPETRQFARLETNLKEAGILQNGKIVPLENYEDINNDLSKDIYSGIDYLCDYSNCENIKTLFSEQYERLEKKEKEEFEKRKKEDLEKHKDNKEKLEDIKKRKFYPPSRRTIIREITEDIKVKSYYDTEDDKKREKLYFYLNSKESLFPLDIKGYSKLMSIFDYKYEDSKKEYAKIDIESEKIEIISNGKTIQILDIKKIIEKLHTIYKENNTLELKKEELTFEIKNYKIILENISIKNPEYTGKDNGRNYYANGYVLVK